MEETPLTQNIEVLSPTYLPAKGNSFANYAAPKVEHTSYSLPTAYLPSNADLFDAIEPNVEHITSHFTTSKLINYVPPNVQPNYYPAEQLTNYQPKNLRTIKLPTGNLINYSSSKPAAVIQNNNGYEYSRPTISF